jgi:aminoglycoside 2'-N-acetyltransferase I
MKAAVKPVKTASGTANGMSARSMTMSIRELLMTASRMRWYRYRLRTGYVEAVATRPSRQREGLGSRVIREVGELIDRSYRLGALATGAGGFYERLGWVAWEGPTSVRTAAGLVRTSEEDGNVFVRLTPTSPELDLSAPISCDWRPGDVW